MRILQEGIKVNPGEKGLSNLYFQIGCIKRYHLPPPDASGAWDAYQEALVIDDFTLNSREKG